MSPRRARLALWLVLMLTLPVPYWVFEAGRVPTIWLIEVATFALAMVWSEGGRVPGIVAGLLTAQAVVSCVVLYLVAYVITKIMTRVCPPSMWATAVMVIVSLMLGLSFFEVYRTPLVAGGSSLNLFGLFV